MVLYNLTAIVEEEFHDEWMAWMKQTFIPEILNTNLFINHCVLKVLDSPNPGITYCFQFNADGPEHYQKFKDSLEAPLLDKYYNRFENKAVSFSTIMEYITNEF